MNTRQGDTTLNHHDQKRLLVLNAVLAGDLSRREAALSLEVSERQLRRVLGAYRQQGAAALVHGNRGRRPAHATPEDVATRVVALARPWAYTSASEVRAARDHRARQPTAHRLGIVAGRQRSHAWNPAVCASVTLRNSRCTRVERRARAHSGRQ